MPIRRSYVDHSPRILFNYEAPNLVNGRDSKVRSEEPLLVHIAVGASPDLDLNYRINHRIKPIKRERTNRISRSSISPRQIHALIRPSPRNSIRETGKLVERKDLVRISGGAIKDLEFGSVGVGAIC